MEDQGHPAQAADELRELTRELIEEELDRLGEAGSGEPSMTEAVEMGLVKARELGLEAGLEPEVVDEVTRETARRVIADAEHGRGRRSAKKSRHTTQILRESEGRGDWLGRPEPGPEDEQRSEAWRDQGLRP